LPKYKLPVACCLKLKAELFVLINKNIPTKQIFINIFAHYFSKIQGKAVEFIPYYQSLLT
jgi:hypothetical protein